MLSVHRWYCGKTVRMLGWCCCCTVFTQFLFLGMAETTQSKLGISNYWWLKATNKRIGLCNTRRVPLLHRRGRETQFDDLDIFFGTADDGILFCPNEQYSAGNQKPVFQPFGNNSAWFGRIGAPTKDFPGSGALCLSHNRYSRCARDDGGFDPTNQVLLVTTNHFLLQEKRPYSKSH